MNDTLLQHAEIQKSIDELSDKVSDVNEYAVKNNIILFRISEKLEKLTKKENVKYSIGDIASSILMICFGIFIVIMSILLYIVVNNDIKNPKPKQVIELQAQCTEVK